MKGNDLPPLAERIRSVLQLVQTRPLKRKTMLFLVMYDIENDKVRNQVAKYLIRKGCIRIQKSVYIADLPRQEYHKIGQTLQAVNQLYQNHDSIILIPLSIDEVKQMRIIGKSLNLQLITDPPNLLFI